MTEETVTEALLVDEDPAGDHGLSTVPVVARIEVPPKAKSSGWGDMSWARR